MIPRVLLYGMGGLAGAMLGSGLGLHLMHSIGLPAFVAGLLAGLFMAIFVGIAHLLSRSLLEEDRREIVPTAPLPRAVPTSAWLIPVGAGPQMGYPLNRPCTLIGRDVDNDIMINSTSVSRTHAQIVRMEGCWLVLDLDSKNGTFVNGDRVVQQQLFDGDRLSIGSIQYLLRIQQPPDARLPEIPLTPLEAPEKPSADPNLGDTLG